HACELFRGEGAFKGIDRAKRHDAIKVMLSTMYHHELPFIYAAIDEKKYSKSTVAQGLFATPEPIIPAFRQCLLGIENWAMTRHPHIVPDVRSVDYNDEYMLIMDDTNDQSLKKRLRDSYRLLRTSRPYLLKSPHHLWHAHDAMYFCDSKDSIGIQLADLCTYFMQRQVAKKSPDSRDESDEFFQMFADRVICVEPKSEYREFFRFHK
ncbi:MAG: DUF3800 domain-containing protein, partial [Candidatus Micrarchaeaceae archaeon]